MSRTAVGLVILLLLAGCSGGVTEAPTSTTTTGPAPTSTTTTDAVDTTTTETTTTTRTTQPPTYGPWGDRTITVSVTNLVNDSRSFEPLVREALTYWETTGRQYGTYEADYELVEDPADADLDIHFVDAVHECGETSEVDSTLGCAPLLGPNSDVAPRERVRVRGGYTDETTVDIIKHEIGHTRGLTHGQEPMPLMAAVDSDAAHYPVTDAADTPNPWKQDHLTVYLDAGPGWDEQTLRRGAEEAIRYYNSGADGWNTANVTLSITDNRSAADIVVRADANEDFGYQGGGYAWNFYGRNIDEDDALEQYDRANLTLGSVRKQHAEWYVGALIGYSLGAKSKDELPEPFRHPDDADREWFD